MFLIDLYVMQKDLFSISIMARDVTFCYIKTGISRLRSLKVEVTNIHSFLDRKLYKYCIVIGDSYVMLRMQRKEEIL